MLKRLEIAGFKSFARKTVLDFSNATTAIVGPNGSGKSNVAEAFRFALGEQSMKSMRGKRSEDLIWAGSHAVSRANRAAVTIVFDNTTRAQGGQESSIPSSRLFPKLDFDEVAIERAIFRDGASEYAINGSKVRLRDVHELLASANIGETGHHIISQGEADRILIAHPRERRAMLEDALGLKSFEYRKAEAERKLEKTRENVREVEALRRELAPHIRFLRKQVERIERAESLTRELIELAQAYFAIEERYVQAERTRTDADRARDAAALEKAARELTAFDERTARDVEGARLAREIREAEKEMERLAGERGELARSIGRTEGALEAAKKRSVAVAHEPYVKVPREDLASLRAEIDHQAALPETAPTATLHAALQAVRNAVGAFFDRFALPNDDYLAEEEQLVHVLEGERAALAEKDSALDAAHTEVREKLARTREASMAHDETGREERHRILALAEEKARLEGAVARHDGRLRELDLLAEELERDRHEVAALAGLAAVSYDASTGFPEEERRVQEDRKRSLERLKIRVEEAGGGGQEVKREFEEATSREDFLAHELEDLAKSAEGLEGLITDLETELAKTFADGLAKVNASFGEFFSLMFGGGSAKLVLEELAVATDNDLDDEEGSGYGDEVESGSRPKTQKPGIDISVNLPKKRVQALMQLSGGERALTSIALIFAMSQVNPPPFLILDETDAALDEANSRRYGDMIASLAKKSQLIVITHNRETMSRAGILYGVTMGNDGVSKLLSIKFEEAVSVAK